MRHLYILAAIAELLAIISYILYLPSFLLANLSDYIYQFSGCAEEVAEDEDEIIKEMENNENKDEDYE